jgi:hypothetical protein
MSSEEGLSILRKMRDESSRIYVAFVEHNKEERFAGTVKEVTEDGLALGKYEVGFFLLNLENVQFRFSDPREAAVPEKAGAVFDSCLLLAWPNGARCRLFVVRDDFNPITSI